MRELTAIFVEATRHISQSYFHVQVDGGNPVYRERVYCYELYHQLRCLWPSQTDYCLNGELDKSAHPILRRLGADYAKPDLLVHKPGHMEGNHAIIEVKSCRAQLAGITKDLNTLSLFQTSVGYQRAIYLLFGYDVETTAKQVQQTAQTIQGLPPIELWLHVAPGSQATLSAVLPAMPTGGS
ncbi:MAG: hypothetical protein JZU65_21060 [Chlorobium sp.]|nr:hypothetical protein [Chlorobium sp.]